MSQRLDWRYHARGIARQMQNRLQLPFGETIPWYEYDDEATQVDPIYGTGAVPNGRMWTPPRFVPALAVIKLEGQEVPSERGLYVYDTLEVILGADALRGVGLYDVIINPDFHLTDRLVYERKVFEVRQVRIRGNLSSNYVVVGVSAVQVKPEELSNDPQFRQYQPWSGAEFNDYADDTAD